MSIVKKIPFVLLFVFGNLGGEISAQDFSHADSVMVEELAHEYVETMDVRMSIPWLPIVKDVLFFALGNLDIKDFKNPALTKNSNHVKVKATNDKMKIEIIINDE